jgi:2-hydroxychromene-2-carboxylate isomerase
MTPTVECFFDCSSPWTYMGFETLLEMAERVGFAVDWRPILVGGVFNKVNQPLYEARANPKVPRKAEYFLKDMADWARFTGLTINFPPRCGHPVNAVKCMRGCVVAQEEGRLIPFARAAFEALWRDEEDFSQDPVLVRIAERAGLDAGRLLARIAEPEVKAKLFANTEELMERNGFGSPTVFVNRTDLYFGNDRMPLIEAAVRRAMAAG